MTAFSTRPFSANNRSYRPRGRPIVVICLDGSADDYLDAALVRSRMPRLQGMAAAGHRGLARGALPSFTNVNNLSIVTGAPPSVHGISGNFFLDPATGQEVMMNAATYLRAETVLAAAAGAGRKVAAITAKEKLRDLFARGLIEAGGIAFSSEKPDQARKQTHGIGDLDRILEAPVPSIYSAAASLEVLRGGLALWERRRADFFYLSTTDYVQHTFAPEAAEALDFYGAIDRELGRWLDIGAVLGLTADHGMNAKQKPDGQPNVIYLETWLEREFGPGFRVILPITDPYVRHHGALGSFATIHLTDPAAAFRQRPALDTVIRRLMDLDGIVEVHDRPTAARKLELPADRIGELVVLAGRDVVLGRRPEHHDLTVLEGGLRSHGGRYEEMVPFIVSEPLAPEYRAKAMGDPRNFDIFDFVVNGVA